MEKQIHTVLYYVDKSEPSLLMRQIYVEGEAYDIFQVSDLKVI